MTDTPLSLTGVYPEHSIRDTERPFRVFEHPNRALDGICHDQIMHPTCGHVSTLLLNHAHIINTCVCLT